MHISGTDAAAAAVIVDSIVTVIVGTRLIHTAKRETAKAAETVKPAIQKELQNALVTLLPAVVSRVAELVKPPPPHGPTAPAPPIADKPTTASLRALKEGTND